jgi:hypothetical protein
MLSLPGLDIVHSHLCVRIPPRARANVDDDRWGDEGFLRNFGGRPPLATEVQGGIHMRPAMLMDMPRIGKEPMLRNDVGV